MSIIVCGHQGCGKSKHAEEIMKHFGLDSCIDGWTPADYAPDNALLLTNAQCDGAIPFSQVAADLGFEV
jgi:cytidylate kinase